MINEPGDPSSEANVYYKGKEYRCAKCNKLLFKYIVKPGPNFAPGGQALMEGIAGYKEFPDGSFIVEICCQRCKKTNIIEWGITFKKEFEETLSKF